MRGKRKEREIERSWHLCALALLLLLLPGHKNATNAANVSFLGVFASSPLPPPLPLPRCKAATSFDEPEASRETRAQVRHMCCMSVYMCVFHVCLCLCLGFCG